MADPKPLDDIRTYRKVADAAYKRGKSGYSVKDEQDAAEYLKTNRASAIEVMGETGTVIRDMKDVHNATANSVHQWNSNLRTEKGRDNNSKNMAFMKADLAKQQAKRAARNAAKKPAPEETTTP